MKFKQVYCSHSLFRNREDNYKLNNCIAHTYTDTGRICVYNTHIASSVYFPHQTAIMEQKEKKNIVYHVHIPSTEKTAKNKLGFTKPSKPTF